MSNKAFGVKRTPAGWVVSEYQIENGKVVSEKQSEPDVRAIALEKLRRDIDVFWDDE